MSPPAFLGDSLYLHAFSWDKSEVLDGTLARRDTDADPDGPRGGYIPNFAITAVFLTLYVGVAVGLTVRFVKHRANTKFMLAMIICAVAYAVGISMRFGLRDKNSSLGLYITEKTLIVLAPCLMIASLYAMLSRFVTSLGAERHLLIPAKRFTRIFVLSDVLTFLIQANGATTAIPKKGDVNNRKVEIGQHIFQAGLVLQLVSFFLFTIVYLVFFFRVSREKNLWLRDAARGKFSDWRYIAFGLFASCICVIVRSVYRVLEATIHDGNNGLARSEGAFYGLDGFPIWLSMAVFVVFWPGRVLMQGYDMESVTSKSPISHSIPLDRV